MIAIAKTKAGFVSRWESYLSSKNIAYILVDVYDNYLISELQKNNCSLFMWHHHHGDYRDVLFAKQLLYSLEVAGIRVFPNFKSCWHFDDKVGQKYLLEAIRAPMVASYVFYTKREAFAWIYQTIFPKVFKLRSGAGSSNVKLVRSSTEAKRIVKRAFGKGFTTDYWGLAMDNIKKFMQGKAKVRDVAKYLALHFFPARYNANMLPEQKGYAYFQDFIPDNRFDIRIIVIDEKAFAIKRMTREGDFRASGSGKIVYDHLQIPLKCVEISFDVAKKIGSQCIAFDYIFDQNDNPLIVEISYGFSPKGYDSCPGYWDLELNWQAGESDPYGWMIEAEIKFA